MTTSGLSSAQAMSLRTMGTFRRIQDQLSSALAAFGLLRSRLEADRSPSPCDASAGCSGRDSRSSTAALSSTDPGQEDALARPKGLFRQEALFRLLGRQLLFLGDRRVPHEHRAIEAMRHLDAPHRELVLGRIGLHEHHALLAVVHQGIRRGSRPRRPAAGCSPWR